MSVRLSRLCSRMWSRMHQPGAFIGVTLLIVASSCSVSPTDVRPTNVNAAASLSAGADSDRGAEVDADTDEARDPAASGTGAGGEGDSTALSPLGPVPVLSHWHAAYAVRICDEVLEPFVDVAASNGIHTHGDGLIHIHPVTEDAAFEMATIEEFATVIGLDLATGVLTLPSGETWTDGDRCGSEAGRVYVDRWDNHLAEGEPQRLFDSPEAQRFLADGELFTISFAPANALPVVPPSLDQLGQVSNLDPDFGDPFVDVDDQASPASVRIWHVEGITAQPCNETQVPERLLASVQIEPVCYGRGDDVPAESVTSARAVHVNRQPAVELRVSPAFRAWLEARFADASGPGLEPIVMLAFEVENGVVFAPRFADLPVSRDRVILVGGMTEETATALAAAISG